MANLLNGGFLAGKKTYIISITGVVGAIAAYLTGEANLADTVQVVLTAVLGATIRDAIDKK